MKKVFVIGISILLILALGTFVACKKTDGENAEDRVGLQKNVSTYHDAVYVGATEDFTVHFVTGEAEKLIIADGAVGDLARFATLTVTPLSASLFNNTYTYTLVGELGEKSGDLKKDVIGATFSAEADGAGDIGKLTSVRIVSEGIMNCEVPLANKLDGALGWKEILKISAEELKTQIEAESDTGALQREIYIKLVNAMPDEDAPYYYYVSFIKSPTEYWALLLDPVKGEVISKKV